MLLLPSFRAYQHSLWISQVNFSLSTPWINASVDLVQAYQWLALNSKEEEIVLSGPRNGTIIAGLSGNIPYLSLSAPPFDNYPEISDDFYHFFGQRWSNQKAQEFIKQEMVRFVFFSPEEKDFDFKSKLDYPFLKKVFENQQVTIFKTQI